MPHDRAALPSQLRALLTIPGDLCLYGAIVSSTHASSPNCCPGLRHTGSRHRRLLPEPYRRRPACHMSSLIPGLPPGSSSGYTIAQCFSSRCSMTIALHTVVPCRSMCYGHHARGGPGCDMDTDPCGPKTCPGSAGPRCSTRFSRIASSSGCAPRGLPPNQVTVCTGILGAYIAFLFLHGWLRLGITLAYAVEVLDGVDGKLARTKLQTSRLGELEHVLDFFMEHAWYLTITIFLVTSTNDAQWWWVGGALMASDLLDNLLYYAGHVWFGKQLDELGPFDRSFRLIAGRRNIYAWMWLFGFWAGLPGAGLRGCPGVGDRHRGGARHPAGVSCASAHGCGLKGTPGTTNGSGMAASCASHAGSMPA